MTQLTDDGFAGGGLLTTIEAALSLVAAPRSDNGREDVPLAEVVSPVGLPEAGIPAGLSGVVYLRSHSFTGFPTCR